jgi:predicted RNA methylase
MDPIQNPFSTVPGRAKSPYDDEAVMSGGARGLVNDFQRADAREARRDPLSEQMTALSARKADIGRVKEAAKQLRDTFLSGEGADLFERDPMSGKVLENPDGSYVPRMGAEIESLRTKSQETVGMLRGALTSATRGQLTEEAKRAAADLTAKEPLYKAKLDKFQRIQDRLQQIKQAEDETEMQLGQYATARLSREGLDLGSPVVPAPISQQGGVARSTREGHNLENAGSNPVPAPTSAPAAPVSTVTPAQLVRIHRDLKQAEDVSAMETTSEQMKTALTQKAARLRGMLQSGLAALPSAELRQRVIERTGPIEGFESMNGGAIAQTGKALVRGGTAEGIFAGGEGLANLARNVLTKTVPDVINWLEELRDMRTGMSPQELETRKADRAKKYAGRTADLEAESEVVGKLRDYGNTTSLIRQNIRTALEVDQQFAESLLGQVAQGGGQMVGTIAAGAAGGPGGVAAMSIGQIYDEAYQDAKQAGQNDATAHSAAMKYLPAAGLDFLSDQLVVGKLLKPLKGKVKVRDVLKDVMVTGAVEGVTEGAQQLYLNQVAKRLEGYDPDRAFDQEVYDSVLVGAIVGGGVTAGGAGLRKLAEPKDQPPQAGATAQPQQPTPGQPGNAKDKSAVDEFNAKLDQIPGGPKDTPKQPVGASPDGQTYHRWTFTDKTGRQESVVATGLKDAIGKLPEGYKPDLKKTPNQEAVAAEGNTATPQDLAGQKIDAEWTAFASESKSLGIPRAEMPQIKTEARGALTQFLKARGVTSIEQEVLPGQLRPTQAEFSPAKVDKARGFEGGDRAILVSADGHVVDGHHQWMAKLTDEPNTPMRVIRLGAPIRELLPAIGEFPSVKAAAGATKPISQSATQQPGQGVGASTKSQATVPPAGKSSSQGLAGGAGSAPNPRSGVETAPAPAIARGKNTPAAFTKAVTTVAGIKANDKAGRFLADFSKRLSKAAPKAFADMEVRVLNQAEWDADAALGSRTPDSAGAYHGETNTLYINSDKSRGDMIANTIVHEAGHFAEKFYLGEVFTKGEWSKLTPDQRREAAAQYDPTYRDAKHDVIDDRQARAEWVAMQFARVVRGDTQGMSTGMRAKLEKFLADVRELVTKWLGDAKLTTKDLDAKILEMMGYADPTVKESSKVAPAPARQPTEKQKPIGKNSRGETIIEDDKGVRSVSDGRFVITEPVSLIPTRQGIETRVDGDRAGTRFETAEEKSARTPAQPRPEPEVVTPPPAKPAVSTELQQLGDDLFGTPAEPAVFNQKFDPAKIESANKFVALLVREHPEVRSRASLAQFVTANFPKARPYSESIFRIMGGFTDMDESGSFAEAYTPAPEPAAAQPAAPSKPMAERSLDAAKEIQRGIRAGERMEWRGLFEITDRAFGGTRADGTYTVKDAYDALEMAVNLEMLSAAKGMADPTTDDAQVAADRVESIADNILAMIPTQTNRSEEQDTMQQFSTPPHFAYVANWVANLRGNADVYLEPSAGVGGLAVFGKNAGARVIVNELSDRRRALLEQMPIADAVTGDNAENLNALYSAEIAKGNIERPTVVVMNPPFSNAAYSGKRGDTMVGAKHVEEALKLLEPGGRLVAIVGEGMAFGKPTFTAWWKGIRANYIVRANIGVDGKNYAKYGTSFDNQILVIDKPAPGQDTRPEPVSGKVANIPELITLLKPVRDERFTPGQVPSRSEQPPAQPAVRGAVAAGGRDARPDNPPASPAARPVAVEPARAGETAKPEPGDTGRRGGAGSQSQSGRGPSEGAPAPERKPAAGKRQPGSDRGAPVPDSGRPTDEPVGTGQPAVESESVGLSAQTPEAARPREEFTDSIFDAYAPRKVKIAGAKAHPSPLVESAAMASIPPPDATYVPKLPKGALEGGAPSLAQVETVVYAGQAHQQFNGDGSRRGFFVGDGTGAGKGITSAAIIADNMLHGRKKAVWLSASAGLSKQARGDFANIGMPDVPMTEFSEVESGKGRIKMKEGVLFGTYSTIGRDLDMNRVPPEFQAGATVRSDDKAAGFTGTATIVRVKPMPKSLTGFSLEVKQPDGTILKDVSSLTVRSVKPATSATKSRVDQIVEWLGADYEGVIIFDESHKAGNAIDIKGDRGTQDASKAGRAVLELQARLPKARFIYSSATGATEVHNLAYAERLGLWGKGTLFNSNKDFIDTIQAAGISAMEIVARDLKAMGRYISRSLSWADVQFDVIEHQLSAEQTSIYDELARGWQIVMTNMEQALQASGAVNNPRAKSAARSAFFGAQQRFFNQILTAMHMPSVLSDAKKSFDDGKALIFQLTNTNQASQERALDALESLADLETMDASPRDILLQYLEKSFPTKLFEEVAEGDTTVWRPVVDKEGKPVDDPELLKKKQELMDRVATLRIPDNPLDMILNVFGADNVTEATGRGRRVVSREDETGAPKKVIERRSKSNVATEVQDFNDDKRRVLVFSKAGGTGFSYHADRRIKNQRQRVHYLVQAGWQANEAVQGLGRAHRSNQAVAPFLKLARTDIPGHKRFISTIARRLAQLGALTTGERRSTGQGLFKDSDNLENEYAHAALKSLYMDAMSSRGEAVEGEADPLSWSSLTTGMGFDEGRFFDSDGKFLEEKIPSVPQFLNRILILPINEQRAVFTAFEEALEANVGLAKAMDQFDDGMQTLRVPRGGTIQKIEERVAYTDPETKQQTKLVEVERVFPAIVRPFEMTQGYRDVRYVRHRRTGKTYAIQPMGQRTTEDGAVVNSFRRVGVHENQQESMDERDIDTRPEPGRIAAGETVGNIRIMELPSEANGDQLIVEQAGRTFNMPAKAERTRETAERLYRATGKVIPGVNENARYVERGTYDNLTVDEARAGWERDLATSEPMERHRDFFLTGLLLPIWKRLGLIFPRVFRFQTDQGERFLGVKIPNRAVERTLKNLGIADGTVQLTPEAVFDQVRKEGTSFPLTNGWKLARVTVGGQQRIEIVGVEPQDFTRLDEAGAFMERIGFRPRYFIPTDEQAGPTVLADILSYAPLTQADRSDPLGTPAEPAPAEQGGEPLGTPPVRGSQQQEEILEKVTGTLEDNRSLAQKATDYLADLGDYLRREFQQKLLDRYTAVKRLERAAVGTNDMDASISAYKWARLTGNLGGVMEYLMRHGQLAYRNGSMVQQPGTKGLLDVLRPVVEGGKLRLWEGYVAAYRANRLLAEGKEKNFGKFKNPKTGEWEWDQVRAQSEINELLALGQQHPEFEQVRQDYVAFQKSVLDVATAAGLIDPAKRAMWERSDYVPFYRIVDALDGDVKGPRARRGFSGQTSGIRQLKGGPQQVAILENIFRNIEQMVDASFKNIAMQRIADLAENNTDLMVKIPYKAVPFKTTAADTVQRLEAAGVDVSGLSEQELNEIVTFWRMRAPEGKDIVSAMYQGKPAYFRVKDKPLLRSIMAMGPDKYSWWMKMLMLPKQGLTTLVTLDPAFMAANTIRDSVSSWVIADTPIKPGWDAMRGFAKALKNDPVKLGILAAGGGTGHYNRMQEGEVRRAFLRMTREERDGFLNSIIDSPGKLARLYRDLGRATENANRVAIAESALKGGASAAEAAFQALDIMDFGLRGDSKALAFFLDTVPFMNARIQGLYRLGRGLMNDPKRVATHGAIILGATMALLASNWDDDRYWALPEWERDLYYHLWLGGRHVRIPKPFEVGQIFSTMPERMMQFMAKDGDSRLFARRMLSMIADTFAMNPIPQAVKPMAERAANLNMLTGGRIISRGDEFKNPEQQMNAYTSLVAREIAEAAPDNAPEWLRSPKTLDFLIRGYFGSLGMYAVDSADALIRAGGDYPEKPESKMGDYWMMRRFSPESDLRDTKFVSEFYELHNDIQQIEAKVKAMRERGDVQDAAAVVSENREALSYGAATESTGKALAAMRRRENQIHDSRTMTPEQKRDELARLAEQRNRLAQQAVTRAPGRPQPIFNPFER